MLRLCTPLLLDGYKCPTAEITAGRGDDTTCCEGQQLTSHAGGTRHILRDFQEQLQSLRAQIAQLNTENSGLKQRLAAADLGLKDAASSSAWMQKELDDQKELLQTAQVRCQGLGASATSIEAHPSTCWQTLTCMGVCAPNGIS